MRSERDAHYWRGELTAADNREKKWHKEANQVVARYIDDRANYVADSTSTRRVNVLWSNTQVLKGALFGRLGVPSVRRVFSASGRDQKVARGISLLLERALVACGNRHDMEVEIEAAIEDMLLAGRGTCWLEYYADVEGDVIRDQSVRVVHVHWQDFRHGPAKHWRDVPWVARLHVMTREDVERQFPGHDVPLNYEMTDRKGWKSSEDSGDIRRAKVWEIWDARDRARLYVAEDYDRILRHDFDPYRLVDFFPCPAPLYGVKPAGLMIPRPEFLQWQDQAAELDRVNTRIYRLLEYLTYCGVYDASHDDSTILADLGKLQDGQFLPYRHFRDLAEGGGLRGAFQTRDLAPIKEAILALSQRQAQLIQHIYEVTGLSDIMRGASNPNETLGAQQLKAQFGAGRLALKKRAIHRFVRHLYAMQAEIVAEMFGRERLAAMTGLPLPLLQEREAARQQVMAAQGMAPADVAMVADAVAWEEIESVLRSDERRNYMVDVETDLTSFDDAQGEKEQRLEYLRTMTELLEKVVPVVQSVPPLGNLMKEFVMFASGPYQVGRVMEEALEDAFDALLSARPEAPPDPAVMKQEMEQRKAEMDMAIRTEEHEAAMREKAVDLRMQELKLQEMMAAAAGGAPGSYDFFGRS